VLFPWSGHAWEVLAFEREERGAFPDEEVGGEVWVGVGGVFEEVCEDGGRGGVVGLVAPEEADFGVEFPSEDEDLVLCA